MYMNSTVTKHTDVRVLTVNLLTTRGDLLSNEQVMRILKLTR